MEPLAQVCHAIRPDWDLRGIVAALVKDSRPFGELATAAVVAAANPSARTPAAIGYWRGDRPATGPRQDEKPPPVELVLAEDQVRDVPEGAARLAYVAACRSALAEGRPQPEPLRRPSDRRAAPTVLVDDNPAATG